MRAFPHILQLAFAVLPESRHSPRKTPRQARAQATVDAIIEAAARIIETDGLQALTTNRMAERAGVGIGSLYQYFPAKEAVLAALIAREAMGFAAAMRATLDATAGALLPAQMQALVEAATTHQLRRPVLARTLDLVETTLPADPAQLADQQALIAAVAVRLSQNGIGDGLQSARDCFAMTRGMIDAAATARETDATALTARICRAVFGYLGLNSAKAPP